MNTYQKLLIALALVISGICRANAQEYNFRTSDISVAPLIGRNYIPSPKGTGSPYLYENWETGSVELLTGDIVKDKLFKFDCFKNELVWMADGKSLVALDNQLIKSFTLFPKRGYAFRKFERTSLKLPFLSDTMVRYLEVLATGTVNLYSYRRIESTAEEVTGNSGGLYRINSYLPSSLYYIHINNLPVKQVRLSKRSIYEAYPEYKGKIRDILRGKHLGSIRQEFQLINAIELINEHWK